MNGIPLDTSIEAARKQFEALRRLDAAARARMTFQLADNLRRTVEAGVKHRYPNWNQQQVNRRAVRILIGRHLFRQAFGDLDVR